MVKSHGGCADNVRSLLYQAAMLLGRIWSVYPAYEGSGIGGLKNLFSTMGMEHHGQGPLGSISTHPRSMERMTVGEITSLGHVLSQS